MFVRLANSRWLVAIAATAPVATAAAAAAVAAAAHTMTTCAPANHKK